MAELTPAEAGGDDPSRVIPHTEPLEGTGSLEAALNREPQPLRQFLKVLGPGLITGASADDPSGIGAYATTGAAFGYAPSGPRSSPSLDGRHPGRLCQGRAGER